MKPKRSNNHLPCSVFGHNFSRVHNLESDSDQLVCSHCNTTVETDIFGDFSASPISNLNIQKALKQLFHLKRKISRTSIGI